jgi:type II secretory pathway component GspD/PulD (secretin)
MLIRSFFAASSLIFVAACGEMPPEPSMESFQETRQKFVDGFVEMEPQSITRVPVSKSVLQPVSISQIIRNDITSIPLDLQFPASSKISDLVSVLGSLNVPIIVNQSDSMQEALIAPLPFSSYQGTFGDLLDVLLRASSITSVQRGDMVHLDTLAQFSVDLPQNQEIIDSIAASIEELGATEIVKSVAGGQMIYKARPDTHEEVIRPFLSRISQNLATISMQVAVVSIAINDSTTQGFDWNAFELGVTTLNQGLAKPQDESSTDIIGTVLDATGAAVRVQSNVSGSLFGTAATYTIGAALNFLSTFGETEITQNVSLKTISGKEVTLRSGQEVPYVSGVSNTTSGDNTTGAVETETVETGLTLKLSPNFDSSTELVTLNLDLTQRQLLQFVELSAGDQLGTISQPLTQDQQLTDLIRVPVGQTVVVGGLQIGNQSVTGSEPSFLRQAIEKGNPFGSRSRNISRSAFFVVIRPTVTIFEPR